MAYPKARGAHCIFILLALLFAVSGQATPVWVSHYNSLSNSHDSARNILMASDDSIYVSGFSSENDHTRSRAVIVKYSSSGQQLWAAENTNFSRVDVDFYQLRLLTALDPYGNFLIAGLSSSDENSMVLVSYSSGGASQWERHFSPGHEIDPRAMAVDAFGNVVVAGHGGYDGAPFVLKYSNTSTLLWSRMYAQLESEIDYAGDGSQFYYPLSVVTLPNGDILTATSAEGHGLMILKHGANGDLLWTAETGRSVMPRQMKVDLLGNIFVAANVSESFESEIIKLNTKGEILWRLPESFAIQQIAVDPAGNLFVTGEPLSGHALALLKVNGNGTEVWRSSIAEHGSYVSWAAGLAVHGTGVSVGFASYDMQAFRWRFAAAHYDAAGVEVWRETYTNATGEAVAMIGDANQGIYLTGVSDPYETGDFQTLKFEVALNPLRPTILSPPQSLEVVAGTNHAGFSVSAGNGPHTFQWRFNGFPIAGATNSALVLTNLNANQAGGYSVVVSNEHAYVVSPEGRLTVRVRPDVHWDEFTPTNQTFVAGNEVRLRASTSGDGPMQFEWRKDGALLSHSNSVFVIDAISSTDAGTYSVTVRSPYGSATNAVSITVVPPTAVDDWRWVRPRPQANHLIAVAFGNGRFVAVGDLGTLLISTDGLNWTVTNLHSASLAGVVFGKGIFVAISYSGAIHTSGDGTTWTKRAVMGERLRHLNGLSFVNDRFVAAGARVYSSPDGMAWSDHGPPPVVSERSVGVSVAYGAGKYMMAADGYMLLSTNLSTWTMHNVESLFASFSGVAYGNGTFVFNSFFTGQDAIYASPDGIAITQRSSIPLCINVAFLNGRFFSVGYTIETSLDGLSWTRVDGPLLEVLRSIAYGNNRYVAVGYDGVIATSPDGQTWTRPEPAVTGFRGIAYGNGRYVITGHNALWTSTDGETWSSIPGLTIQQPNAILWSHGNFVVVGNQGELHTSRDGLTWARVVVTSDNLKGIIHDGQRFVVFGESSTLFSTNAVSWAARGRFEGWFANGLVFGGGTYLIYDNYQLWRSTNAIDWSRQLYHELNANSVAYGNGTFVGVGSYASFTSPDGLSWRTHPVQIWLNTVIFANGMFVADGEDGAFATSTNGENWVAHRTPAWGSPIAYANGAFWKVGYAETIVRSAQIQPAIRTRKTGSSLELIVQAYPGQPCRLQRAATLGTWTDFQTFTPQAETTTLIDHNPNPQGAFYRVVSP